MAKQPSQLNEPLRLRIEPLVSVADSLTQRVLAELPTHDGLATAARGVSVAARQAERVDRAMKSPFSPHRLPAIFLAAALVCLAFWVYWRFFHVATLTVAFPDRDATLLRDQVEGRQRVNLRRVMVPGSREAVEQVSAGKVDLAFVQGGMPIPPDLPRLETPRPEIVLFLTRSTRATDPSGVRRVLTSAPGEGSHSVLQHFLRAWGIEPQVSIDHDWQRLTDDPNYELSPELDAVLVVKDPADEKTRQGVLKLAQAGFMLQSPELGAKAQRLEFLRREIIAPAFLCAFPEVLPAADYATYQVATYLVARRDLTPRRLAQAAHLLDLRPPSIADSEFDPNTADASEMFQGIEAFMGIIVNIGLAFLALLGLDVMTYRKQFHELNSLISLLSMLQSNKDVLGLTDDKQKTENLLYLSLVSDLLGVISMISSYYTQENSSLLFNNLSEVIHQRCDGLKINIQLKILHATVRLA